MENPTHTFDSEQSAYLARVLYELELRNELLEQKVNALQVYQNKLINGPAFSARLNPVTSLPNNVATKVAFNIEEFDTHSCYDTTLSRFTPNVNGIYIINAVVQLSTANTGNVIVIAKNGSSYIFGNAQQQSIQSEILSAHGLVLCNGTTDFIEVFLTVSGSNSSTDTANSLLLKFQGCLIKPL